MQGKIFPLVRFAALLFVVAALVGFAALQDPAAKVWQFPGPEGGEFRFQVIQNMERLEQPKVSPKHNWLFEWVTSGVSRESVEEKQLQLRIRIFSQQKKEENDPAPMVARMALRMWDYNVRKLRIGHKPMYDDGRVHFYLCWGGQAGGEQLFDEDEEGGRARRVNTIYIYQIQNAKDPVELAREVAHEYGHATLPPVGGFETPEDWGNGYLGEKLYMRHLRDFSLSGAFGPADAMGATPEQLDRFVKREVEPLSEKVWLNGPDFSRLPGTGQGALDAYLGLALYAEEILPPRAFARSLQLIGSTKAADYPDAVILAAAEVETFAIVPPKSLAGKDVWIPLGNGKLEGIKPIKRSGHWALVRPLTGVIRVTNPKG
jgi:hypothetical protein